MTRAPMDQMNHEAAVAHFYDDGGEGAGQAYTELMGTIWHHGARDAEQAGKSIREAAEILERRLMNLACLRPGDRALDFGSGPGGATINMARMTEATFVGISNTDTLSQRARALAEMGGIQDQVHFVTVGDHEYRTLGAWPDRCFDAVTFFESVCHLPDKQTFFRAAYRVLRPGGRLVGLDWLQRPYGDYQTEEQIRRIIEPVCQHIRLAELGTLASYSQLISNAGFTVTHAIDEYAGEPCWGSTPPEDRERWLTYSGPSGELFQDGKRALDHARGTGVFTVGYFVATRPDR